MKYREHALVPRLRRRRSCVERRCIVCAVLVLASIGPIFEGVVIVAALVLIAVLLRDT